MNSATALRALSALKTTYGRGSGSRKRVLLRRLASARLASADAVVQLHELLCFLRAYPDDQRVYAAVSRMLECFGDRPDLRRVRKELVNSGIAGTDIVYPFGFSTARWLESHCGANLHIEWPEFDHPAALNGRLQLFAAWAERPVFDEPPLDGRAWLDRLKGGCTDAAFVVQRSDALPVSGMAKDHLYDELGMPIRVVAGPDTPNRSGARVPGHPIVTQQASLRASRPNLRAELAVPPRSIRRLPRRDAQAYLDLARESMVTRSRDLYTFTAANLGDARLIDAGDGLEFFCVGVEPEQRLLLDAVYGLLTLRNGVPVGYALFSALWRSSEVAYNVFETFRGGESAWIYGRMLAAIHALFGADTFTIDPYQLGHENAEGLESGAWWFYAKLGFEPWDRATIRLADAERARVASRPGYRTPPATLRKLVRSNLFMQVGRRRRDVIGAIPVDRIGLQVTSYMNARFGSDRERGSEVLADEAAERLRVDGWRRFPPGERLFWLRWAPLVALLPEVDDWPAADREAVAAVIRAKGGARESEFVDRFDTHPKLGRAIAALAHRRLPQKP
jgi:hypothetical protein